MRGFEGEMVRAMRPVVSRATSSRIWLRSSAGRVRKREDEAIGLIVRYGDVLDTCDGFGAVADEDEVKHEVFKGMKSFMYENTGIACMCV